MRTTRLRHPTLSELARISDEEARSELKEHLRRCPRCRTAAADYLWLSRELTTVLKTAAETVGVPVPIWQSVRERLSAARRRQVVIMRFSVAACLLLAVGTMLCSPPVRDLAAQGLTMPPQVAVARPVIRTTAGIAVATPTPSLGLAALSTPVPLLPPTPPAVDL
ncbi:MAG: hypothetical protein N2508_14620 [Anaerolineae bacterium]|nr:hypothetical protein [Anaerolineae bacterium]